MEDWTDEELFRLYKESIEPQTSSDALFDYQMALTDQMEEEARMEQDAVTSGHQGTSNVSEEDKQVRKLKLILLS